MMLCNCIDYEFSFYYKYRVVWSIKMESDSISNAAAIGVRVKCRYERMLGRMSGRMSRRADEREGKTRI